MNDVEEEEEEEEAVWSTLLLPGHALSSVNLQKHACRAFFRVHRRLACEQGCFSDAEEKRQVLSAREGYAFLPGLPLSI